MFVPGDWKIKINGETVFLSSNKKPNNNAPKNIKGDYDLSIHGNKIVLVDNVDGTTVEAKCSPQDNFDIGEGIKEAFKKLNEERERIKKLNEERERIKKEKENEIKVGDWVEVVNGWEGYSTFTNFFEDYDIISYGLKFRYGVIAKNGLVGQVKFIADGKYVIEVKKDSKISSGKQYSNATCNNSVYLIGKDGIKKVNIPHAKA